MRKNLFKLLSLDSIAITSIAIVSLLSSRVSAHDGLPICFAPGAGGGSEWTLEEFIPEMASRNIEWIPLSAGSRGSVVERAERTAELIQERLDVDPYFKCHIYAYSMGSPVMRYLYHHIPLEIRGKVVHPSRIFKSMTSFSGANRGTPLAKWFGFASGSRDISEKNIAKYNSPQSPETYSPEPDEIPSFSYLTFMGSKEDSDSFVIRTGFKLITRAYRKRELDTRNDGIVPLISQKFGEVLGVYQVEHHFFDGDIGLRPWAPDVYESHWKLLEGRD